MRIITDDPVLGYVLALLRSRLERLRAAGELEREGGYSTEAVVVISLLVAGALVAVGYIVAKVKAAAQGIKLQ